MENNGDVKFSTEKQKQPDVLRLGDTFELPHDKIVLLGRIDKIVKGAHVYRISGLENNLGISNYALGLKYDSVGHQIVVSKPMFTMGFKEYEGKNRIIIDTRDEQITVDDKFSQNQRKGGTVIDQIIVGDNEMENGFILMAAGNDRFKLTGVKSEGKNL